MQMRVIWKQVLGYLAQIGDVMAVEPEILKEQPLIESTKRYKQGSEIDEQYMMSREGRPLSADYLFSEKDDASVP